MVLTAFLALLRRDFLLAARCCGDIAMILCFFILAAILFPLGIGFDPETLAKTAPGILWACALFAAMLSLDRLFAADYEDGALEQISLSPLGLELVALEKAFLHWVTTGLPLLLAAPLLAVLLGMDERALPALLCSMAIGAPILSLTGVVGAALVLGSRRGGVLLSLLVLPLCLPVLIFGAGVIELSMMGLAWGNEILFMGVMGLLAFAVAPFATAMALRQALE